MASRGAASQMAARSRTTKAESKKTCESHTRCQPPRRAAAAKRSPNVSHGVGAISSASTSPASASRRVCRRKLWNSEAVVSTRSLRPRGRHEYRRVTNSCVLGAKAISFGAGAPMRRATCACACGTTSAKTRSAHLRSASAAESFQYCACAASVASGHGWWLCAAKCRRFGSAARKREKCSPSIARSGILDRFHVDAQEHVVGEAGKELAHVEIAALDVAREVRAADFLVGEHRVHGAAEIRDLQRDRARHAVNGEISAGGGHAIAVEDEVGRAEGDLGGF